MIRAISIAYIIILLAAAILLSITLRQAMSSDALVQMLERREGVLPGQTKVIQECGCTIRYLGTTVRGNRYTVTIDKLD